MQLLHPERFRSGLAVVVEKEVQVNAVWDACHPSFWAVLPYFEIIREKRNLIILCHPERVSLQLGHVQIFDQKFAVGIIHGVIAGGPDGVTKCFDDIGGGLDPHPVGAVGGRLGALDIEYNRQAELIVPQIVQYEFRLLDGLSPADRLRIEVDPDLHPRIGRAAHILVEFAVNMEFPFGIPPVAQPDKSIVYTVVFDGIPVDIPLECGYVDHFDPSE